MNKRWLLFLLVLTAFPVSRAYAIPMFARKYNMPCSTCHTGDFKLNDFGGLFDVNGYQLPGTIEKTPVWQSNAPVFSLLMQDRAAYQTSHNDFSGVDSNKSAFNSLVATIVSGGVIAPHVSYMTEYDVESTLGELQASLEYAFVNFNNIFGTDMGQCNIRFGKARLEIPIELTPEFYRAQYLIYSYPLLVSSRPLNFELQSAMYGASVYGRWAELPGSPFYQFAMTAGDVSDISLSGAHMLYGRIAPSFSLGPVPASLGVTAISAMQTVDPAAQQDTLNNTASAYGVDLQLNDPWSGQYAMYGQVMRFHNSNVSFNNNLMYQDALGGYVELNDVIVPEKVTLMLRYDFLNGQTESTTATKQVNTTQIGLTVKYFFLPNVNIFLEGYQQNISTTPSTSLPSTGTAFYMSAGFFYGI